MSLPDGYAVRPLTADDAPGLTEAYRRNREHLAPWEPVREESFYTETGQAELLAARLVSDAAGHGMSWLVVRDDLVVGRVNLSNIVRGVFQSAHAGYWVDHEHQGRGIATAGLRFACEQAARAGLHRVEAGTLAHNTASQRVLRSAGFDEIGFAPRYLFIAGDWQDHTLFQRILHDRPL
ncbi:MAG TPA: GNAT family N-acetyltransferase [Nocardioidaceae bacterium]|nr:GNAT family N-acetyltransferase [Nocardioidaceae bacterium]